MSVAVRIVGKTGSDVSFSCFPLAGKAVLCYGKDSFWLRIRLFYGVEKAVLWCEKGCFAARKSLFRVAEKAFRGRRRVDDAWLCGVCGWLSGGCLKCGKIAYLWKKLLCSGFKAFSWSCRWMFFLIFAL